MKRLIDILLSAMALLFLAGVFLILIILVRLKLGRPVFFIQPRSGQSGKCFNLFKFRTMLDVNDKNGTDLPDSERLTSFGSKLRSSSLDELPGIWNVLKGDMSLVGPRPLLVEYLPLYNKEQAKRHNVRPGITGWAQVNGRNSISWEEKFKLDVWYIENRTFWLDIKILFLTVKKVFVKEGISADGEVTMHKFTGSK